MLILTIGFAATGSRGTGPRRLTTASPHQETPMFYGFSITDLTSIFVMQGFAGLILFSVYVLMALGLAIIFG